MKKYAIYMVSWGGTEKVLWDNLTYKEAYEICVSENWEIESMNGGYIWDLEIREM